MPEKNILIKFILIIYHDGFDENEKISKNQEIREDCEN